MSEFFDIPIYQRALIATLIIGFVNGYASAFVLLHRSPLKLTALSHSLLPGVAIATLIVGLGVVSAFLGAVTAAVAIGILTVLLSRVSKISDDTVLAVLYTGAFAVGIMVLQQVGSNQNLNHWLLGNILGLSDLDLWMSFSVGIVAVSLLSLYRRSVVINLFDPEVAASLGIRTRILDYASFAVLILVLVTTLQAVGCILAIGMIVTPAAIVRPFISTPDSLFPLSGLVGAAGSALGLILSIQFGQPAGASIAATLAALFVVSVAFRSLLTKKQ
ncbi:MAG: iron chelate uptake ABC transporter family permease subunit [Akkermansiaceae bacterium]|jgi:ABC-type Mn2+/Zn2+ transport system permease subunit